MTNCFQVTNGREWELIGKKDPQLPQMFYPIQVGRADLQLVLTPTTQDPTMTLGGGDTVAARSALLLHLGDHRPQVHHGQLQGQDDLGRRHRQG